MPMFASTTSSGYRDPLQALSIKALEQRQKDLLAQQAAAPGITVVESFDEMLARVPVPHDAAPSGEARAA